MKKTLKSFGMVALTVAILSCSKEADIISTEQTGGSPAAVPVSQEGDTPADLSGLDPEKYLLGFGASVEDIRTKAEVNLSTGALSFVQGDEALVVCGEQTGTYVYDSASGKFSPKSAEDAVAVAGNDAQVYYPAAEFACSDAGVSFTMPEAVVAGDAADLGNKLPLCGLIPASETPVASFKNLGSVLYVRFNSTTTDGETITGVELSGSGVNITGSGAVTWTDTDSDSVPDTPALASLDGGTSLTIDCRTAAKHLTSASYQDFFFFLPPSGSYASMTIKAVYGKSDGSNEYTTYEQFSRSSTMTLARGKLQIIQKSLSGFFGGGDGSAEYPYLIASGDQFKALSTIGNATADGSTGRLYYEYNNNTKRNFFRSAGAHYLQTADIDFDNAGEKGDLSSYMVGIAGSNGDEASFKGLYDGGSHKISNFSISTPSTKWVGLFSNVAGEIKNLTLENISVEGDQSVGGITGWLNGKVTGCSVTGTSSVTGTNGVSGIAANIRNASLVSGCTNSASITGSGNNGGIVGYMADAGRIERCTNHGEVNSTGWTVGGVLGSCNNSGGKVLGCQNFGAVTSTQGNVGGIVGAAASGMEINASSTPAPSVMTRNEGAVNGTQSVGGIIGRLAGGSVACSTNTGTITGSSNNVGGIVGYKVSGGVWSAVRNHGNVTGIHSVGGIVGYQAAGGLCGNLTTGNLANRVVNEGNVTATGKDGSNYSAAGGIIGRMDGGTLGDAAALKTAENEGNVTGTGSGDGVGGIVGWLKAGTVSRCRSNGTITNNRKSVGGAIGWMTAGTVINSYAKGIVKGLGQVGGFVGYIYAEDDSYILNCASGASRVVATNKATNDAVGGFVGYMNQKSADFATKKVVIANSVAWESVIKAPNEDNAASNKVRVGGFAGVMNYQSGGGANVILQNCYYQGLPTTMGCGGNVDDDSLPTVGPNQGGMVGIFGGYLKGVEKDCYADRANDPDNAIYAGSASYYSGSSNQNRLVTAIMYGESKITWAIKKVNGDTTSEGEIAGNTYYLDGLLNHVVNLVGSTYAGVALSTWDNYTVGTGKYFYPSALTELGEDFYKK